MEYSLSELIDRYAIELRKNWYGAENDAQLGKIEAAIRDSQPGIHGELLLATVMVALANADISNLEWQVRAGRHLSLEEVGRRALVIRRINDRRVAAKNRIADLLDGDPEKRVYGYGPLLPAEKFTMEVQGWSSDQAIQPAEQATGLCVINVPTAESDSEIT